MFKNLKPIMFENSRIPGWVSKFTPIDAYAISFFIFVFAKGELSSLTKRHETIHFQQQLELLFVGQWLLYAYYFVRNYMKLKDGKMSYYLNPFELEAFVGAPNINYLKTRKRYSSWWAYRKQYKSGGHSKKTKK